jgi:DNA-3-methyladenine glycosylase II
MDAALRKAERHLTRRDPVMRRLVREHGPCTLMQSPQPHFHNLVWAIVNQQLSVKAAGSIERRLLDRLGAEQFQPSHFIRTRETTLRRCGLSGAKIRYLRALAGRVGSGEVDFEVLATQDDETVSGQLMALPGIGRWTADMFLMFSLGRLDVLPLGDLALRRSIRHNYGLEDDSDLDVYLEVSEQWRPYRTVASWYCWAAVD